MGYTDATVDNGQDFTQYGQLRIPSLNNDCLTAESPTGSTTYITHKPCSTTDDQSQLAQYFLLYTTDQGIKVIHLGGTHKQSASFEGYDYGPGSTTPGKAYQLTRGTSDSDQASFYID